ncbi:IPT/TIG domain-containing protein [Xanthobacteraceae bacterium A53D]
MLLLAAALVAPGPAWAQSNPDPRLFTGGALDHGTFSSLLDPTLAGPDAPAVSGVDANLGGGSGATVGGAGGSDTSLGDPGDLGGSSGVDVGVSPDTSQANAAILGGIAPDRGSTAGGTIVTITGAGLASASVVTFGGHPATILSADDTAIVVQTPSHMAGVVDLLITTADGSLSWPGAFAFQSSAIPALSAVSPSQGSTAGGAVVTLTGSGFTGASAVTFGGTAAMSFTVESDTTIRVTVPPHAAGMVNVTISSPNGTGTLASAFTYVQPIISLSPAVGPFPAGVVGEPYAQTVTAAGGAAPYHFVITSGVLPVGMVFSAHTGALTGTPTAPGNYSFVLTVADANAVTGTASYSLNVIEQLPVAGEAMLNVPFNALETPVNLPLTGGAATSFAIASPPAHGSARVSGMQVVYQPARNYHGMDNFSYTATNAGGTSAPAAVIVQVAPPDPVVDSIDPTTGPTRGGTSVVFSGSGLSTTTSVTFGGVPATISSSTDSTLTVVAPPHVAGSVSVVISGAGDTLQFNNAFSYIPQPVPTVTTAMPSAGSTAGGTVVTLSGSGFTNAMAVTFGGAAAMSFSVNSDTSITAVTPPHAAGSVNVAVTSAGGTGTLASAFTYVPPPPTLSGASPDAGFSTGGLSVTLSGTGLANTTAVTFGGTPAASFTVNSDTSVTAVTPARAPGRVAVAVTTPGGTATRDLAFMYFPPFPPSVTSISPATGGIAGGTSVTLTGSSFTGATAVEFGGRPATSITVHSATSITAVTPAHVAGVVDVLVTAPGGSNGLTRGFTYLPPAPTLTSVSPATGDTAGGARVTLTGTNFGEGMTVTFGGVAATMVTVHSATSLSAVTPAHAAGVVDVVVSGAGGTATRAGGFTYIPPPPILSALSPPTGSISGGTSVTLTGTGFTGVTAVTFGGSPATSLTILSDTSITAVTPAHAAGAVDVRIVGPGATIEVARAFTYVVPAPALTGVSPAIGGTAGGTSVTLSGTGLSGATAVTFGGTAATITAGTDTSLTVTAPPHAAGVVDVAVTTPTGTSTLTRAFTYAVPVPTLASVAPATGSTAGGTEVTLTGTWLAEATSVTFGGTAATIGAKTDTALTVTAPAHAAGVVDVAVTTPTGTSTLTRAFTYAVPVPTLASIAPATGSTAGGTEVTLTGTWLAEATSVTFGGTAATIGAKTDTSLTVTAPAHAAGVVDVAVTTPSGTVALTRAFTYAVPVPTLSGISPAGSGTLGGIEVTLTGTSLAGATEVRFGGTVASRVTVTNGTTLTATVPAHAAGIVDVVVSTPAGMVTLAGAFSYDLVPLTLSPSAGALPPGRIGVAYHQAFAASGGSGTYSYMPLGGLPEGLVLSREGVLSGTPTAAASPPFTIMATDSLSNMGTATYTLVTEAALPSAEPVVATVKANSARNSLPAAISESATAVAIEAEPRNGSAAPAGKAILYTPKPGFAGQDRLTYRAKNAAGVSEPASVTITVQAPVVTLSPSTLPNPTGGVAYGPITLTAAGGTGAYRYAVSGGALPPGLTLTPAGVLSGTPTRAGTFRFALSATDAAAASGGQDYAVTVAAPVPVAQNLQAELLAGTTARVLLTAGAAGGPFTGAAISTPPPAAAGRATITGGNGAYTLVYAATAGAAGTVSVGYTLSNRWGTSAPATITFTVTARPDPALDPEVRGMLTAQAQAAQQLAGSQIRNFNERLERLHSKSGRQNGSMDVRIGFAQDTNTGWDPQALGRTARPYSTEAYAYGPFGASSPFGPPDLQMPGADQKSGGGAGAGGGDDGGPMVWTGGFVNFSNNRNNNLDISQTMIGVSGGVDMKLHDDFIAGIGFGYGRSAADVGLAGTNVISQAFSGALYASYNTGRNIFIDGLVGYGHLSMDNERYVTASGALAQSARSGNQVFGALTASYEHVSGPLLVSPYGRGEVTWSQLGGFAETGGGVYNLMYGDQSILTVAGVLGVRAEYALETSWSVLTMRGRLEYTHDFGGNSTATLGYADLGIGLPYALEVDPMEANSATVGLGLDARLHNGFLLSLTYQGMVGFSGDSESQTVSVRANARF